MACNNLKELNIHELLRDIEEEFEEIATVLQRDYTPESAAFRVKAMTAALEKIFEEFGKTLQNARPGIHGRPGTVVAEVAAEYLRVGEDLKKSQEPARPLTLQEQIEVLRVAEKTYLVQVRKLNKYLKEEDDPGHVMIQKVILEMLRKMRSLAKSTRPTKP